MSPRTAPGPGRSPRCAFLVAAEPHEYVVDDHHVRAPLEALGWTLESIPWDRAEDWARYDRVVVRSTWDYHRRLPDFEAALARIAAADTALGNPLDVVRWNLRKTYLLDLQERGVPVIPTRVVDRLAPGSLDALRRQLGARELVVKPVVGASGIDVARVTFEDDRAPDREATFQDQASEVEAAFRDRPALVQPFLPTVVTHGEVSLIYLAGELSHGIRKRPAAGEFRTQEERGAVIDPYRPDAELRTVGRKALDAVGVPTLYARVDLIPDPEDGWRVVELELVEPSLYLRTDAGAPTRFARAIVDWTG